MFCLDSSDLEKKDIKITEYVQQSRTLHTNNIVSSGAHCCPETNFIFSVFLFLFFCFYSLSFHFLILFIAFRSNSNRCDILWENAQWHQKSRKKKKRNTKHYIHRFFLRDISRYCEWLNECDFLANHSFARLIILSHLVTFLLFALHFVNVELFSWYSFNFVLVDVFGCCVCCCLSLVFIAQFCFRFKKFVFSFFWKCSIAMNHDFNTLK